MATKNTKQSVEPITEQKTELNDQVDGASLNLEDAIADELLNDIDWQKVKAALIRKVKAKFIEMLIGNPSDRPVVISQYPELAVLPSSDSDEVKAA
jgi:hypothetical protein